MGNSHVDWRIAAIWEEPQDPVKSRKSKGELAAEIRIKPGSLFYD